MYIDRHGRRRAQIPQSRIKAPLGCIAGIEIPYKKNEDLLNSA